MNVHEWLDQVRMLDELITARLVEKQQLWDLATKMTPNMDGMPHATGVSDKVGNVATKLADLAMETDRLVDNYIDRKHEVLDALEKLPPNQFGVLHRYYIRGMTVEQIAEDMNKSERQIMRYKGKGIKNLQSVIKCH